MSSSLILQPGEHRTFDFDCSTSGLRTDENILGIISVQDYVSPDKGKTWTAANDLSFDDGGAIISGQIIQMLTDGTNGVNKTLYKISIRFSTDVSPICEADFYIYVIDI